MVTALKFQTGDMHTHAVLWGCAHTFKNVLNVIKKGVSQKGGGT